LKPNQVGDKTRANMMGWAKGFRGGKHEMYEGGVRIPFIVRWPGKIPSGRVNHSSILSGLDFLPTLCHLTGTSYDKKKFEGLNVSDVWPKKENADNFAFPRAKHRKHLIPQTFSCHNLYRSNDKVSAGNPNRIKYCYD
jgi:arylsulfatase A-like enzyme